MGKKKQLRKRIAGQLKTIAKDQAKIEQEYGKPTPNIVLIRKWEKDIDIARRAVRQLEDRLDK